MPAPRHTRAGVHGAVTAAVSTATCDAVSHHALHHGSPYPKELQQPLSLPRIRGSGLNMTQPQAPAAPTSPVDLLCHSLDSFSDPCSPWGPPLEMDPPLDLDPPLNQPPTPTPASEEDSELVHPPADVAGSSNDGNGGDDACSNEAVDISIVNDGEAAFDGDGDLGIGDADEDVDGDGGDGISLGCRRFSSAAPTADGDEATDGSAVVSGATSAVEGGLAVSARPAPSPFVIATATAAAAAASAGLGYVPASLTSSRARDGRLGAAGRGDLIQWSDGLGGPEMSANGGGAAGASSAAGTGTSFSGAGTMSATIVTLQFAGPGRAGAEVHRSAGGIDFRPCRHSGGGSRDSSPPSTSGSVRDISPSGNGMASRSGGGGVRRNVTSSGQWSTHGSTASVRPQPVPSMGLEGVGLVGSGMATASGQLPMVQSSASSTGRAVAAKIQIEVSSSNTRKDLNIQGRGRTVVALASVVACNSSGGTAASPSPLPPPRRCHPSAAAAVTSSGESSGRAAATSSTSPLSVHASGTVLGGTAAQHDLHSKALWSSARRLRVSLHRLHQQYQNYHALVRCPDGGEQSGSLQGNLQQLHSYSEGGGGRLHAEASGTSMGTAVDPRLHVDGHNRKHQCQEVPPTVATAISPSGGASGVRGGGAGARAPRQSRPPVVRRSASAPSNRPPNGAQVLRMSTDKHLHVEPGMPKGRIHAVQSAVSLTELDWALRDYVTPVVMTWYDGCGGDSTAAQPLLSATSLPVSPRVTGKGCDNPRRVRSAGSSPVPTVISTVPPLQTAAAITAATGADASVAEAVTVGLFSAPSPSPRPARRNVVAPPVMVMPSMAVAPTAVEDPDLAEVLEKAMRRAAVEKAKMRAARRAASKAAAATTTSTAPAHLGAEAHPGHPIGGSVSGRRRTEAGEQSPATSPLQVASERARNAELLIQRQAEDWARMHRQMPPRRRLAPSVMKLVEKWFSLVDDDGSGTLETRELAAALQAAGVPCSESDVLELVSSIDANRDGAVSMSEFMSFLLKELGAGKNLISGEYELPSGGQLPFAAMIARLKRLRVLDDVMRGGKARNRYVDMLYNRDAMENEIGLSEKISTGFTAIPILANLDRGVSGACKPRAAGASGGGCGSVSRRGGRVRLQQLFQQFREAQLRATSEAGEGEGFESGPKARSESEGEGSIPVMSPHRWEERNSRRPQADGDGGGGSGAEGGSSGAYDSDFDALAAGFGERVCGVSCYPRHSAEVSMLQGACSSHRSSATGGMLLLLAPEAPLRTVPPDDTSPTLFELTEVLLPPEESGAIGAGGNAEESGEASDMTEPLIQLWDLKQREQAPASQAAAAAVAAAPRLLLPVISPLPPVKRPTTRAFQRALLGVRHSAPEYLFRRMGLPGPMEAAAAAAAPAGPSSPRKENMFSSGSPPHGHSTTVGGAGDTAAATGSASPRGGSCRHATSSFRAVLSTDTDGAPGDGGGGGSGGDVGSEPSAVSILTGSVSSPDVQTTSANASKAASALAGAYYTMYGAGFTRYKRWSMYDIDPAAENPDYWQAKAAALLMRRTSRAIRGVPGVGVTVLSATAAAAATAMAVADAAKDIELIHPAVVATAVLAADSAASRALPPAADGLPCCDRGGTSKQLLPPTSAHRRQLQLPTSTTAQSEGTAVTWHLPSLPSGGSGAATAAATVVVRTVMSSPSYSTATPAAMAMGSLSADVATSGGDGDRCPHGGWRQDKQPIPATTAAVASATTSMKGSKRQMGGRASRAMIRGASKQLSTHSTVIPAAADAAALSSPTGSPNSTCGSPMQFVKRPNHGGREGNPRLAADALRRRRTQPPMALEGEMFLQRSPSRSPPSPSPRMSLSRSQPSQPQQRFSPQLQQRSS